MVEYMRLIILNHRFYLNAFNNKKNVVIFFISFLGILQGVKKPQTSSYFNSMSEYCKMDNNPQKITGNEKTPINVAHHGTESRAGNGEKYGGSGDANGYEATAGGGDELTAAQEV